MSVFQLLVLGLCNGMLVSRTPMRLPSIVTTTTTGAAIDQQASLSSLEINLNDDSILFGSVALFAFVILLDSGRQPVDLEREPELANFVERDKEDVIVLLALILLRGYKRTLSPGLGKGRRFVPTCSEYAALAFKEFGSVRGAVLTLWRLTRCSPIGGNGYDPPLWPPPAFNAPNSFTRKDHI